jgi:thioredoxin-like negative regulator of GroEL
VQDIRTLASFFISEFDDSKVGKLLTAAREDIDHSRPDSAMEKIIESMHLDKAYQDEIARKTGIALFHIYGKNHSVTKSQRKYFDMAIY